MYITLVNQQDNKTDKVERVINSTQQLNLLESELDSTTNMTFIFAWVL